MLAWAEELAGAGGTAIGYPVEYGGEGAVGRSIAAFETLAFGDLSLLVKFGVQFGLFGGAVLHLGTERHHAAHLAGDRALELARLLRDDRDRPRLQRAGARDHGDLRPGGGEFDVHTPDAYARKDYIGNAARDGRHGGRASRSSIVGGERARRARAARAAARRARRRRCRA